MNLTDKALSAIIMRLAELGLNEDEITNSLGITKSKIISLKAGKKIADILNNKIEAKARMVEDALYRRAVGFEYEETVNAAESKPSVRSAKPEKSNPVKSSEKSSAKSTVKTAIPDVSACIFWLKNRMPDKWRDPKDVINGKKSIIELMESFDDDN